MKTLRLLLPELSGTIFKRCALLILMLSSATAFAQRYPATTSIQLIPPYPVSLEDYSKPGSDRVLASVVFNDFSQSSWNIKFRLTIEGSGVVLQTNTESIMETIRLVPGMPEQFTGYDLAPYFDFRNMRFQGITADDVLTKGGLPEGNYTFTLEAADARTGIIISNKAIATAWLILNDPPQITFPICGDRIPFGDPQNIAFQWLPMHTSSPNRSLNTEYEFTLVEVPAGINANEAILSAMPILQTTVSTPNFLYGISEPLLENGRTYAFRIRAVDGDGLNLFKNEGYSQICWFNYGFPTNGKITTSRPGNNELADAEDNLVFAWSAPDNLVPSQFVSYTLKVAELNEGEDPATAIDIDPEWYEETTGDMSSPSGWSLRLPKPLESEKSFVWQVKAFSSGIEVARSEVMRFSVSPEVKEFIAGPHIVKIVSISNGDLNNFSGTGKLKLLEDGTEFDIEFSRLKISSLGGKLIMAGGEIYYTLPESFPVTELVPTEKENGFAYFHPKAIRLVRDELSMQGTVQWDLPFPQITGEKAVVRSSEVWINYDLFKLNGYAALDNSNVFNLIDPAGFELNLTPGTSNFFIRQNEYTQNFDGEIILPENIRSKDGTRVRTGFKQVHQLYYNETTTLDKPISLVRNLNLDLVPQEMVIDFSEQSSPEKLSSDAGWKGIYFETYQVVYPVSVDARQLALDQPITHDYQLSGTSAKAWAGTNGLEFFLEQRFDEASEDYLLFNTFRGQVEYNKLVIEAGRVKEGMLKGRIRIPLLEGKYFSFTIPVSHDGFEEGYIEEGLTGTTYTFNQGGGDQEMQIGIVQATFADNERLDAVIDLKWNGIGVSITELDGLRIYGNGSIGFFVPNGRRDLPVQQTGSIGNYPVTVRSISAGYDRGNYFFNTTAEIMLSEDLAGENGPPEVELFSINEAVFTAREQGAIEKIEEKSGTHLAGRVTLPIGNNRQYHADGRLMVDSTYVTLEVFLVKLEGFVKLTYDDPDWGTSFQGALHGAIRVPVNANVHATMIVGRSDETPFYFFEAGLVVGGADRGADENLSIANRAGSNRNGGKKRSFGSIARLREGIPLGPLSVIGGDFRFYNHMSHTVPGDVTAGGTGHEISFEPDPNNSYGVYGRMAMRDRATQGEIFNLDVAFELSRSTTGSMTYGFEGLIEVGTSRRGDEPGKTPAQASVAKSNEWAMTGTGKFVFNEDEQHYLGDFWLVVATPALCAEGGLGFDVKPGYWKISLGKPERRITFIPGCAGWAPTGYLIFDPNEFELGLGLGLNVGIESPWINIVGNYFKAKADFGFSAGIIVGIQVRPSFAVKKAGIWAEVWATVAVDYDTWFESGTWIIASANLGGQLTAYFEDRTRLDGTLEGSVSVIGITVGFDMDIDHTF